MKIKMLTSMSGPTLQRNHGDEIEVPDAEAKRLIEAGFAAPVRSEQRETTSQQATTEKAVKA
jgi:hypothetical protein